MAWCIAQIHFKNAAPRTGGMGWENKSFVPWFRLAGESLLRDLNLPFCFMFLSRGCHRLNNSNFLSNARNGNKLGRKITPRQMVSPVHAKERAPGCRGQMDLAASPPWIQD